MATATKSYEQLIVTIQALQKRLKETERQRDELKIQDAVKLEHTRQLKQGQQKLEQKTEDLKMSNRELEQFASIAAHDLQEPLHVIVNFLDLLSLKFKNELDPTAREYIDYAQKAATQAQELIRALFSYARIEGKLKIEAVDLNVVLTEALANPRMAIGESKAKIVRDTLPTIQATKTLMVQVFQNLISNAIKYCSEERPLNIKITARPEQDKWIFCVADNGIGIANEHLDQVFEMFKRLHSKSKYPGAGIGLASCKKIIEFHGGKIWVESEQNKGSVFCFSLPIRKSSSEAK